MFELRLNKTAQKAKELGFKQFTTTLSVSPHKVSKIFLKKVLKQQKQLAADLNLQILILKKNNGFNVTQKIAAYNNMYKQNYCGCEFSIRKELPAQEA